MYHTSIFHLPHLNSFERLEVQNNTNLVHCCHKHVSQHIGPHSLEPLGSQRFWNIERMVEE